MQTKLWMIRHFRYIVELEAPHHIWPGSCCISVPQTL